MIDIGANLTNKAFRSDLVPVLERAKAAGVCRILVTGTSVPGSQEAQQLAARHPGMLAATAGVHPHHASDCNADTLGELRRLAVLPEVVALGECGLDFNRDLSPRPVQEKWFERQLELAAELGMPVFLHERDAHERLLAIVSRHLPALPGAVVHCFTGDRAALEAYLELGLFIGITGWICDERRGQHLAEIVGLIPPERLMIETDSPYLLPRTLRPRPKSRRNEPGYLVEVASKVAEATGRTREQVVRETTRTAADFFRLTDPGREGLPTSPAR